MYGKPSCNACRKLAEYYNKEPNCFDCLPDILSENQPAFRVYNLVSDQVITAGMDGEVLGLQHYAIWQIIDRYKDRFGIFDESDCFERVVRISAILLELERENRPNR